MSVTGQSGNLSVRRPAQVITPGASVPTEAGGAYYFEPLQTSDSRAPTTENLFAYLQLLLGRKYTLILGSLAGLSLGWLLAFVQTPLYRARTAIEIESMSESDALYRIIDGDWRGTGSNTVVTPQSYLETQLRVLQSRSFQSRVVSKLKAAPRAASQYEFSRPRHLLTMIGLRSKSEEASVVPPVKFQMEILDNTRIVELTSESPDPHFAAEAAKTMADEFIAYNLETQSETAERTMKWLTGQLQDMHNKVEVSRARLEQYSQQSGLKFEAQQPDAEKSKLLDLEKELSTAHVSRINEQTAYEVALAEGLKNPTFDDRVAGYQAELLKLRAQLDQLNKRYTPEYSQIKKVKSEIETLESTIKQHITGQISSLRNRYTAAKIREQHLLDALNTQSNVLADAAKKGMEYDTLKRDLERNRKLYEDLLQKATEVSLSTAMRASSQIRVVDAAETPSRPYRPTPAKTTALGFITGLFFSLGVVIVREHTNRRLRTPGETPFHIGVPELAVIPSFDRALLAPGKSSVPGVRGRSLLSMIKPTRIMGRSRVELFLTDDKGGPVAESFRGAVVSILASLGTKTTAHRVLITSPTKSDGKSTIVSNLGITLAEMGHSVLLIDGDIRKPSLNRLFDLSNSWGLTTIVSGTTDLNSLPIEALFQKTKVERLNVLTSGPGTSSVMQILHSKRTEQLLERVSNSFEFVIVDSPPALHFSDTRLLGFLVDWVILVVKAGTTTRDAALTIKQRLASDNIRIMGTILNNWDRSPANTYGYYGYSWDPYAQ